MYKKNQTFKFFVLSSLICLFGSLSCFVMDDPPPVNANYQHQESMPPVNATVAK